jgi:hypothetical protein
MREKCNLSQIRAYNVAVKKKQDGNDDKRSRVFRFSTLEQLGRNIDKSARFTIRLTEAINEGVPLAGLPNHPIIKPHEQARRTDELLHDALHEPDSVLGIDWYVEFPLRTGAIRHSPIIQGKIIV